MVCVSSIEEGTTAADIILELGISRPVILFLPAASDATLDPRLFADAVHSWSDIKSVVLRFSAGMCPKEEKKKSAILTC